MDYLRRKRIGREIARLEAAMNELVQEHQDGQTADVHPPSAPSAFFASFIASLMTEDEEGEVEIPSFVLCATLVAFELGAKMGANGTKFSDFTPCSCSTLSDSEIVEFMEEVDGR